MTIWEQVEATNDTRTIREALMVVPCILTWIACHVADYQVAVVCVNLTIWAPSLMPKMPFMNGVRLFGINATAGIDNDRMVASNSNNYETGPEQPASRQRQRPPRTPRQR